MIPKLAIEKTGAAKWQATYLSKNPWAKHKMWAQSRAKRLGVPFSLTVAEVRHAWVRDNADQLNRPSIDRIFPHLGYGRANIRFIERSLNSARAQIGRKSTDAQREAGRRNLTGWHNKKLV